MVNISQIQFRGRTRSRHYVHINVFCGFNFAVSWLSTRIAKIGSQIFMAVHGMYYTFGLTPIVGVKNSDVSVAFCFVPSK